MTRFARRLLLAAAVAGTYPNAALGHEERLISGKVEAVDHRTIVVSEAGAALRTVNLVSDTEVFVCKQANHLGGVSPGTPVRVKYIDTGRLPAAARVIFLFRSNYQPR
jgi:hypothetical protein